MTSIEFHRCICSDRVWQLFFVVFSRFRSLLSEFFSFCFWPSFLGIKSHLHYRLVAQQSLAYTSVSHLCSCSSRGIDRSTSLRTNHLYEAGGPGTLTCRAALFLGASSLSLKHHRDWVWFLWCVSLRKVLGVRSSKVLCLSVKHHLSCQSTGVGPFHRAFSLWVEACSLLHLWVSLLASGHLVRLGM